MTTASAPKRNRLRGISLRVQAMVMIGGLLVVIVGIYIALLSAALGNSFGRIQDELTEQRVDHLIRQFERIASRQQLWTTAEAVSDETFAFVRSNHTDYLAARLTDLRGLMAPATLIAVFDRQKNLLRAAHTDAQNKVVEGLPTDVDQEWFRHSGLLGAGGEMTLLKTLPPGTLMISSSPILHSDGSGPSPGWLLIGQILDSAWYSEIRQLTDVEARPENPALDLVSSGYDLRRTVSSEDLGICHIYSASGQNWGGRSMLIEFEDSLGRDPARIAIDVPSVVLSAALAIRDNIVWLSVASGILLTAASLLAVEFLFVRRIARMDRDLKELIENPGTTVRLNAAGNDEFARLAASANKLFEALRRRRGEAESQQKLLAGVLDSASEGILAFRARRERDGTVSDFLIVLANRSAERMTGCPAGGLVGSTLLGLLPTTKEVGLFERFVEVVETDRPVDDELLLDEPNLRGWFHISATPWKDGLVATFEEIGARKKAEQQLQKNLEEIERFNRAMLGREDRILEMKSEVNDLRQRLGLPPAYKVDSRTDGH